jgi:hypothetical protein
VTNNTGNSNFHQAVTQNGKRIEPAQLAFHGRISELVITFSEPVSLPILSTPADKGGYLSDWDRNLHRTAVTEETAPQSTPTPIPASAPLPTPTPLPLVDHTLTASEKEFSWDGWDVKINNVLFSQNVNGQIASLDTVYVILSMTVTNTSNDGQSFVLQNRIKLMIGDKAFDTEDLSDDN